MFELIYGDVGSGKTLLMTMNLHNLQKNKLDVLSNYELTFKHKLLTDEDIKKYAEWEYNNTAIGIDELHVYVDSRMPTSKQNRIIGYWFTQSRKRNCQIYGTTQFIRQIDLRLRGVIDYLTQCVAYKTKPTKKNKKYNSGFKLGSGKCDLCYYFRKNEDTMECFCIHPKNKIKIYMNDNSCKYYILPDVWIRINRLHMFSNKSTNKLFYANPYFKLYDTSKVIKPILSED